MFFESFNCGRHKKKTFHLIMFCTMLAEKNPHNAMKTYYLMKFKFYMLPKFLLGINVT